jgi:ribosomal protein S1
MSGANPGWSWEDVKRHYPIGSVVDGTVVAVAPFGVFIDLGVGFEGLLLVPEMAGENRKRIEDYPKVGESVSATVIFHNDQAQKLKLLQKAIIGQTQS